MCSREWKNRGNSKVIHGGMKREGQFKCLKHWLSESFVEVWIRVQDNKEIMATFTFKEKKKKNIAFSLLSIVSEG